MKRKRKITKVGRKSAKPPDGRWRQLEDRVAALEIIAGFLFGQMSDDQRRLVEAEPRTTAKIEMIGLNSARQSATEQTDARKRERRRT